MRTGWQEVHAESQEMARAPSTATTLLLELGTKSPSDPSLSQALQHKIPDFLKYLMGGKDE